MAKKVDITDKLTFDGNPMLLIKGVEVEVNADAPTMLKVMGLMDSAGETVEMNAICEAYELIFPEKSREVKFTTTVQMHLYLSLTEIQEKSQNIHLTS